jgi:phage portal protein BeeE
MYVPFGMDAEMTNPGDDSGLFIEGRNALRLDVANFFNLPAALLDGSTSTASLTYSTQEGRRNEVFDYGIAYWTAPIENALSLDNVCPRGQRIRFDFTDLNAAANVPTGPVTED